MAGKKEEKEQLEEPEKETPEPDASTKTVSQEEIDALVATAAEKGKAEAWEEYQGIQRVVSQKDQRIKELEEREAQPSKSDDDLLQILIDERKGKPSEYGEADPLIPKLESIVSKRKQAQSQAQVATFNRKADAVYKRAEEAYGEDDVDNLHSIRTLIRAGDFDLAEKKLAKVTKKEPPKKEEKQEVADDTFVSEEAKRKWMEEHGLLESETGLPSASLGSKQEAMQKYISGEITSEEAQKRGVVFD